MTKKLTNEEFLEKVIQVHGNKYEYMELYSKAHVKIKIKCKKHNKIFEMTPNNHLRGQGCKYCKGWECFSTEDFIEVSKSIHGDRYDYSYSIFINAKTKIKIICRKHGLFETFPNNHFAYNCYKCGRDVTEKAKLITKEEFIRKAKEIHNNLYNYDEIIYTIKDIKIKIKCNQCGDIFYQKPSNHLQGQGCIRCGGRKQLTNEEFIEKVKKNHGDIFLFDLTQYKNWDTKVILICKKHGQFEKKPGSIISSKQSGCPKCSSIYSKPENKWLDLLSIPNEFRQKRIKINNKLYKLDAFDPITNTIYEFYGDFWHGNPEIYNHEDENRVNKKSFGYLYQKTLKKEQELKSAGYKVISIWESDWKKQNKGK